MSLLPFIVVAPTLCHCFPFFKVKLTVNCRLPTEFRKDHPEGLLPRCYQITGAKGLS